MYTYKWYVVRMIIKQFAEHTGSISVCSLNVVDAVFKERRNYKEVIET